MHIKLILGNDGSMAFAVDAAPGLTFEEAKAKITALTDILQGMNIPIQFDGEVERHIHPHETTNVLAHA